MVRTRKTKILLIDDDKIIVEDLKRTLLQNGYDTNSVFTGHEALNLIEREHFDIVITDIKMPDIGDFTIIEEIKKKDRDIAVIMVTAHSSIQTAIDAVRKGAEDYLTKPVNIDELELVLNRIKGKQLLIRQNKELRHKLDEKYNYAGLIGRSFSYKIFKKE